MRPAAFVPLAVLLLAATARPQDAPAGEPVEVPASSTVGAALPVFGLPEVRSLEPGDAERERPSVGFAGEFRDLLAEEAAQAGAALELADAAPRIVVKGPPAAVELVRTRVGELAGAVDGRVVVEVAALRVAADAGDPADREGFAALARAATSELVFGERLTLRRGEVARRESLERRTFVSGVEAHVAQEASVVPTVVHELVTGRRLAVQARALPSGRVAVQVALHLSRVGPAGDAPAAGTVELPAVRFLSLAVPFALAEGEAALARAPDPFGPGAVLLRVALVQAPPAAHGPWRVADLRSVAGSAAPEQGFVTPGWFGGDLVEEPFSDDGLAERVEAAQRRLAATAIEGMPLGAGLVALRGGPVTAFEEVFEDELRTGVLTRRGAALDAARLAAAPWFDPLEGRVTADVPEGAGTRLAPLRLPVRGDTPTLLLVGTWRRLVADVDVEVAQAALAVVPSVRTHFEGEAVLARLLPAAAGRPVTVDVAHRACKTLAHERRPVVLRSQVYGRDGNDAGTQVDALTTATSRSRLAVSRGVTAEVRAEGGTAVLDLWSAE